MAQTTGGFHTVLSSPAVYETFERLVGSRLGRDRLVADYIRPFSGMRLLDIGCGPASILDHLPPDIMYVGIDHSERYLESARGRYGHRATFHAQRADSIDIGEKGFDIVTAIGLVHHLSDSETLALMRTMKSKLKPGGRAITIDGVYINGQNPVARLMLKLDRGRNVRWAHEYGSLAAEVFGPGRVELRVRGDLMRIPYDHCVLICAA